MKIGDIPLSLKTIKTCKSTVALDWSKNDSSSTLIKEHFNTHIMVLNLKSGYWWKKQPKKVPFEKISYDKEIPAGIYLIDKQFCKKYIELSSNNKTNTLIESTYLYIMLQRSLNQKLFVSIPEPTKQYTFNILNAFSE
jgi:hypothetical protein